MILKTVEQNSDKHSYMINAVQQYLSEKRCDDTKNMLQDALIKCSEIKEKPQNNIVRSVKIIIRDLDAKCDIEEELTPRRIYKILDAVNNQYAIIKENKAKVGEIIKKSEESSQDTKAFINKVNNLKKI